MRQYIRHPSEMPINYHLVTSKGHHDFSDSLYDVSTGGLSFRSNKKLEPGRFVHIKIEVQPPAFEADAIVRWCRPEGDGYHVGLQFKDAEVEYSIRMIEQICHIEQYRNLVKRTEGRELSSQQAAREWISIYAEDFPQ